MTLEKTTGALLIACCAASPTLSAEEASKPTYSAPTRGFFLEQGTVNTGKRASLELHSGAAAIDSGGGIRLGLPKMELILNTGMNNSGTNGSNDAMVKWALPPLNEDHKESENFDWAFIGGLSQFDDDNTNQIHLRFGVSATLRADAATFTLAPSFRYVDDDIDDETFFELGLGGYLGVIDTAAGLFSVGTELNITTQDNMDSQLTLGGRWSYSERINIDIIPVVLNNNSAANSDINGLPGLVRLNVVF